MESPAAGAVHVWRIDLDVPPAAMARLAALLAADERRAAGTLRDPGRRRFVVARAARRCILGAYVGCAPADVRFTIAARGKPELADAAGLAFSASRSGALAVVAVAGESPLGVDAERRAPLDDLESVARIALSPDELRPWASLPKPARLGAFYRIWTRKEAYLKATGTGIADGLTRVTVEPVPPGWSFADVRLRPGWAVTVAAQRTHFDVRRLTWEPTG